MLVTLIWWSSRDKSYYQQFNMVCCSLNGYTMEWSQDEGNENVQQDFEKRGNESFNIMYYYKDTERERAK